MAPGGSPAPDGVALGGDSSGAAAGQVAPTAELTTRRTYAAHPSAGGFRFYALFFAAVALLALSLPWLASASPSSAKGAQAVCS